MSMGYSAGEHGVWLRWGHKSRWFDYTWLREGCKCPQCVDPSTKQRSFNMAAIQGDIAADSVHWDGHQLEIRWTRDIPGYTDHVTKYSAEYLFDRSVKKLGLGSLRHRIYWNKRKMAQLQHWISFEDYMNDDAKFAAAMRQLSMLGMIFVKDIPDSREMVEKVATRMGPLRNTFYGPTWDVRSVPDAKNVAYTDKPLEFHMDLLYMNEPPGFQLLHCLQNSCEGGETLFSDTFKVESRMRQNYPDDADHLAATELCYEYDHDHADYKNSWPVLNYTELKNKKVLRNVNYSPPFQGHTSITTWRKMMERMDKPPSPLARFAGLLKSEQNVFDTKLEPGQCVIFENRRVAHSRNQFNASSGQRWLAGAYVDEDALLSQFARCARDHREVWDNTYEDITTASEADAAAAREAAKEWRNAAPEREA
jgi:alpha-ketoglutarate-dependent taurine dioxygenase